LSRITIEVEGLAEVLESIDARLARLEEKVHALSAVDRRWYSTSGAARYLDTTEVGIRSLIQSGKLAASHNGSGKLMIEQHELDRHARAGDNGR